jgi:hypothetical protein
LQVGLCSRGVVCWLLAEKIGNVNSVMKTVP